MFSYAHPKLRSYSRRLRARHAPMSRDLCALGDMARAGRCRTLPLSSSTHRARPDIRRERWSHMASISRRQPTSSITIPRLRRTEHRTVVFLPLCHVLGRDVADHFAAHLAPRSAFRRGHRTICRRRCSRLRRPSCSPSRATCSNSPRRCCSASTTRRRQARERGASPCTSRACTRGGAGSAASLR